MAGYSHTSLPAKLGVTGAATPVVLYAPKEYRQLLPEHYANMATALTGESDWIQVFYQDKKQLDNEFSLLKSHLQANGQLWISWPKKTSGVTSDLDENIVREIGLKHGLVDVKVAAINEVWSGLKFVYRLKDRPAKVS